MKVLFSVEEFNNSKGTEKLALECENCGCIFHAYKRNIDYEQKHPERGRLKYCSIKCCSKSQKKIKNFNIECKCGKIFQIEITENNFKKGKYKKLYTSVKILCINCGKEFNPSNKKHKFCSEVCRNTKSEIKIICINCGKEFKSTNRRKKCCSKECCISRMRMGAKKGGLKSAQSQSRRSKNEIEFANLCKKKFQTILTNEPIFNSWDADIIIEDIKIAILWNGKWHYEKITKKHSVKQVRNRDKRKILEIKKCGYIPYVIKDLGDFNITKINLEFNKFLEFIENILEK